MGAVFNFYFFFLNQTILLLLSSRCPSVTARAGVVLLCRRNYIEDCVNSTIKCNLKANREAPYHLSLATHRL